MRWIEEWGTAFWKIMRKASSVDQRLAPTGLSTNAMRNSGAITHPDLVSNEFRSYLGFTCPGLCVVILLTRRSGPNPSCDPTLERARSTDLVLEPAATCPVNSLASLLKEGRKK